MQIVARRYEDGQPVQVTVQAGRVVRVRRASVSLSGAESDALPYLAPGFWDIQINGYGGQEFSSRELTADAVERIVTQHYAFGVTGLYPTFTTQSFEVLAAGMRAVATACEQLPASRQAIRGIHLEGPYFATEDGPRGAHPVEHCRAPSWEEFQRLQDAAGGRIGILTMSPHFEQVADFIERVVGSGVIVSIGHTGASGEQIRAAVDAGARLSTHLGNGAHGVLPRHPNYLWDQLAEDRLWASLIVDSHHLPPEVVKTFVRAKRPERVILVSDVSGLAGLPAGTYTSSGCELEILDDGRLVIAGQRRFLAGASRPIGVGIARVIRDAGVSLAEAVRMTTNNPAHLLGQPERELVPGHPADLTLFHLADDPITGPHLRVLATVAAGEVVYQASDLPAKLIS